MPKITNLVLNSGGLRSLIALASLASEVSSDAIALMHFLLPTPNAAKRKDHFEQQARYFKIEHVIEVNLAYLQPDAKPHGEQTPISLARPQMLLAALAQGVQWEAQRITVPVQFDADPDQQARYLEQIILTQQIAELEQDTVIQIFSPLVDLTDEQLIEMGSQLHVPWELGWSCNLHGEKPCQTCLECVRRRGAFAAAGVVDHDAT